MWLLQPMAQQQAKKTDWLVQPVSQMLCDWCSRWLNDIYTQVQGKRTRALKMHAKPIVLVSQTCVVFLMSWPLHENIS